MPKSDHKRTSSKHKIDRRLGVNLWGRPKSPLNDREYAPGQHGQRRKKPTDFGVQLMAKQKLKGYYGNIGEKQFKKYYQEAVRRQGDTGQNLIGILESRLDAVLYRSKLAPTVFAARQIIKPFLLLHAGCRSIFQFGYTSGRTIKTQSPSICFLFTSAAAVFCIFDDFSET